MIEAIHVIADLLTGTASGIAIYIFWRKGPEIASALKVLVAFSFQTTLTELNQKLDRLNEYDASDAEELPEVKAILHEIAGQIRGNAKICQSAPDLPAKIEQLANGRRLTEPKKRALVSEIREVLRNLNVSSVRDIVGE